MANTTLTPNAGDLNLSNKNPRLTPLTAALLAVGVLVSVIANNPTTLTPNCGALNATGQTAARGSTGILTPATGALIVGDQSVAASGSLTPGTGALTSSGEAGTTFQSLVKTPGVGNLLFSQGPAITPTTGALTTAGAAPSFVEGVSVTRTPGAGWLTLEALPVYVPGFSGTKTPGTGALFFGEPALQALNTSLTPGAGRLVLGTALGITTNTGAASFTGQAPSLLTNSIRMPLTGALVATGNAPGPFATNRTPTTGALTLTGQLAAASRSITTGTGALAFVGSFPGVGGFVQAAPPSGDLALEGFAPTVEVSGVSVRPGAGALTAAGGAPSLLADRRIEPAPGALILAGQTSPIPGQSMTTATGAASFASDPPELRYAVFIRPPGGLLVAAGRIPNVGGAPPRGGVRFRPKSGRMVFAVPDREESLT